MRQGIYRTIQVTVTLLLIIFGAVTLVVCYNYTRASAIEQLRRTADICAALERTPEELSVALNNATDGKIRVTFIDSDGNVVYDSSVNGTLENHADRTEVRQALKTGSGEISRRSDTLNKSMYYYAIKYGDGVLRFSIEYSNIWSALQIILPIILAAVLIIWFFAYKMSGRVVEKILKPVDDLVSTIDNIDIIGKCVVETDCEELKPIASTVTSMAERVTEYVSEVEKTGRIRQEFSANVSHELKTPLTTIKGFGELLDGGMITDLDDVKKYGGIIYAESSRLLSLINDIMRITEIDSMPSGLFETVNLKKCCEDAIEILYMKAAQNDIKVMFNGRTVMVSGIATHLCEVIANLIDNAIKYNRPGGSVWIKLCRQGDTAVLSVRDNGTAYPKAALTVYSSGSTAWINHAHAKAAARAWVWQ